MALVALSQGDSRPSTLASTQVVSSSIPLSCASPFNPYASGNLSLAVACGEHVFNRTATTVLSSGAIQYTYDVMGLKTIYTVPPTNFNPQSASAATLAQYGIPSPPHRGVQHTSNGRKW